MSPTAISTLVCKKRSFLIAILVLFLRVTAGEAQENSVPTLLQLEKPWQRGMCCGVNALYAFLRINDVEADYDQILFKLSPSTQGSSLEELRQVANPLVGRTQVLRYAEEDLASIPLPFIAHASGAGAANGHFVCVFGFSGDDVLVIDGAEGVVRHISRTRFLQMWTGYALVKPAIFSSIACIAIFGMLVLVSLWISTRVFITYRKLRSCDSHVTLASS
jgi:ABC-type bacteriocin/lantibiotic exporter with double-glycine peptidase domain